MVQTDWLQATESIQQSIPPEMLYSLSLITELYEIGLVTAVEVEDQDFYQHILRHLRRAARSSAACYLQYYAEQRRFTLVATQSDGPAGERLASAIEGTGMERLALQGPGETVVTTIIDEQRVLIVTLNWNQVLLGVVVLAQDSSTLLDERRILLSYLGNIAALLLRNYEVQQTRSKAELERERNRIARDLHDGVAQRIVHILHKLELIRRMLEKQQNRQALSEVQHAHIQIESSLQYLRQAISSLRPPELEVYPFAQALQALLEEYKAHNPGMEMSCSLSEEQPPVALETPIFRFIQEAFNNVCRHAQATRVELSIFVSNGFLEVKVSDNGVGMLAEQALRKSQRGYKRAESMGLRTMRERVREAGGNWGIESRPGQGTLVWARFPLTVSSGCLTERERDVLRLIVEGMTNRTIAERLSISSDTVKSHIHHIIQKMHVKDRTQAAVVATRNGWL